MAIRYVVRPRRRSGAMVALMPQFTAVGSGDASSPTYTGTLLGVMPQFTASGSGSLIGAPSGEWADVYVTHTGLAAALGTNGRRVGIRGNTLSDFNPSITSGNGGQLIFHAAQSFDGLEPTIEFRPPTTLIDGNGQYCTILSKDLQNSGINDIKQINFRWLEYIGPRYWDLSTNLRPKWIDFQGSTSRFEELNRNRMAIFDQPQPALGDTIYLCVTSTTFQSYHYPIGDTTNASKLIAIRGTNNHALNPPQTGGGEWLCFEQKCDVSQVRGNPFGRNELRVWSRDGAMTGRFLRIGLNYDPSWNFARQWISSCGGLGSYLNGNATPHADNYKLWSHCTFAANMGIDELIGPPPGFLL